MTTEKRLNMIQFEIITKKATTDLVQQIGYSRPQIMSTTSLLNGTSSEIPSSSLATSFSA